MPYVIDAINLEKSPILWPTLNSDYIKKLCDILKSETKHSSQKEQSPQMKAAMHAISAPNVCVLEDKYYICSKCWQIYSEDSPDCMDSVTYINGALMLKDIKYECSISVMQMMLYIEYNTNKSIIVPISQSKISYDGCNTIIILKTKALSLLLNNELDVLSIIEAFDNRLPVNILVNDIDLSNQIQESKGQKYSKYKQYQHSPHNELRFYNLKKLNQVINHPNILKVNRIFHRIDADYVEFAEPVQCIKDYNKPNSFTELQIKRISKALIDAVYYLHTLGICHRSIKLENIYISQKRQILLAGLDSAVFLSRKDRINDYSGTVIYSPPELFTGGSLFKGVDVWQLGVAIFYLFCGHFPFASSTKEETISNIVNKSPQFLTPNWVFATEEVINMIKLMLTKDSTTRPTISEIKSHPWLRKIFKK